MLWVTLCISLSSKDLLERPWVEGNFTAAQTLNNH